VQRRWEVTYVRRRIEERKDGDKEGKKEGRFGRQKKQERWIGYRVSPIVQDKLFRGANLIWK
jgi:hypothetical protein